MNTNNQIMNSRNGKKRNRKIINRRRVRPVRRSSNKITILNQNGRFASDIYRCKLVWQDPTGIRAPTGSSQSLNWYYRSSAYDPDPSILTGSIPGMAELSNLYAEYCVHAIHLDLEVANPNTENLILVAWPGNSFYNVNSLSATDLAEYSGNLRAKAQIMGTVNSSNLCRLQTTASGNSLVGKRFKTDLDYSSSTSTNPIQMFYLNCGVYCPQSNITYGVTIRARLSFDIEFFKLRQLES